MSSLESSEMIRDTAGAVYVGRHEPATKGTFDLSFN